MLKKLLISTAISTALISTPLLAEDSSKSPSMGSDDPQTTSGSAQAGTSAQGQDFDELDQNKDGQLDEEELNRFGSTAAGSTTTQSGEDEGHGERMLKMYDLDGDGSVSQKELEKGLESKDKME